MKKAAILLVCLLMVMSCALVGCDGGKTEESKAPQQSSAESTGSTAEEAAGYIDENGNYVLVDMPEFSFTKKEFNVAVISQEGHSTYYNEDLDPDLYDTTDEAIKTAVRERNNLISEKYGVEVKAVPVKNIKEEIRLDIEGDTHMYDAAMPYMCDAATLAKDNKLYELGQYSSYMHTDAPWYDHLAISAGTVADKLFFVTGDISMMPKVVTFAIVFNKDMLKELDPDLNLYRKVENMEWTYDYMMDLSKTATVSYDDEPGMGYGDKWGLSSSNQDAVTYYLASGESLCTKDSDDLPVIALGKNSRSTSIAEKILTTLRDPGVWAIRVEEMGSDPWVKSLAIFAEGRALFRTNAFSAIKKLRAYTNCCEFGVIPMPLMDDAQSEYYSPSNPQFATVICIPKSAENPEFSAYMIEVLSCYGKNLLSPAYYEATLKNRDMRDYDSEKMLDQYVFKNIVYDVGRVYSFGGIGTMLSEMMNKTGVTLSSTLGDSEDVIIGAIEECTAAFAD